MQLISDNWLKFGFFKFSYIVIVAIMSYYAHARAASLSQISGRMRFTIEIPSIKPKESG
jgi:hypothetical protein